MIVYLNGEYLPAEQAKISPLDRGFLFGDGIYEAIPSYGGRTVALGRAAILFFVDGYPAYACFRLQHSPRA